MPALALLGLIVIAIGAVLVIKPGTADAAAPAINATVQGLRKWEGLYTYLYRDNRGYFTTGIGNLTNTLEKCLKLPWRVGGELATPGEITRQWNAAQDSASGNYKPQYYENLTTMRISERDAIDLCAFRLRNEFLPALRERFQDFNTFPSTAQQALIDMIYSLGAGGLDKFKTMVQACKVRNFIGASQACNRVGGRPERDEYVRNLFIAAAKVTNVS